MTLTTTHHGAEIPVIGFGTWQLEGRDARDGVITAIEAGYRHIDTAQKYGNEGMVGEGLKDAQLPREDVFLTTKVWIENFRDGDLQRSARESLDRLQTDHVDLLLLHWPNEDVPMNETFAALADAREQGLTRHIGVSNFTTSLLAKARDLCPVPLIVNQVEYHPFIDQTAVFEATQAADMALTAYSPLAQGDVFDNPVIKQIADRHGKSPGQVVMRWFIQQPGVIAIPRSTSAEHIRDNNDVHDFALEPAEMARISSLKSRHMRIVDPDFAPEWDIPAG